MEIREFFISKEELKKIPRKERNLFIRLCIALTDINIFQKLISYSSWETRDQVVNRAKLQIALNAIFVVCAKLYEAWSLIDTRKGWEKKSSKKRRKKYFSDNWFPKKYNSQLNQNSQESLDFLKNYFGDESNNIKIIRDKISSHYDEDKITDYFTSTNLDGVFLYIPRHEAMHIYSTANYVFMHGFLEEIMSGDHEKAMEKLGAEILDVSSHFKRIALNYFQIILDRHLKGNEPKLFKLENIKSYKNMPLTFFSTD